MKSVLTLLAVALLVGPATGGQRSKPVPITPQGAGFTAIFPNEPTEVEKEVATAAGNLTVRKFRVEHRSVMYSVTVTEYPDGPGTVSVDELLEGVRDGMKGADGSVKAEEKIDLDGVPGRKLVIEAGRNQTQAMAFLSGRRLYLVIAAGAKRSFREDELASFFKSFAWAK